MSKAEILEALPLLSSQERTEILDQLWRLEDATGPTGREKILLNEAQAIYDVDSTAGSPWRETEARLRHRS